jgi:hypothetical protein
VGFRNELESPERTSVSEFLSMTILLSECECIAITSGLHDIVRDNVFSPSKCLEFYATVDAIFRDKFEQSAS